MAFEQAPPDILVVHLCGNDLAWNPSKVLVLDTVWDLKWLKTRYPLMRITWSTIVPHLEWRDTQFSSMLTWPGGVLTVRSAEQSAVALDW